MAFGFLLALSKPSSSSFSKKAIANEFKTRGRRFLDSNALTVLDVVDVVDDDDDEVDVVDLDDEDGGEVDEGEGCFDFRLEAADEAAAASVTGGGCSSCP